MELKAMNSCNALSNSYRKTLEQEINHLGCEREEDCQVYVESKHDGNEMVIIEKNKIITIGYQF